MPPATTAKPDNPLDRRIAIMNYYDRGAFIGAKSAEEIRNELGGTSRSVSIALRELGFSIAERRKSRRVPTGQGRKTKQVVIPRKWAPPADLDWPARARLERQIRAAGASVYATKAAFGSATPPLPVVEQAIGQLVGDEIPINARGALRKAINSIISEREDLVAEEDAGRAQLMQAAMEQVWLAAKPTDPDDPREDEAELHAAGQSVRAELKRRLDSLALPDAQPEAR